MFYVCGKNLTMMNERREVVRDLTLNPIKNGKTTINDLANKLNEKGLKTTFGNEYKGGRGMYSLIRSTYYWLRENGEEETAELVVDIYTNNKGVNIIRPENNNQK